MSTEAIIIIVAVVALIAVLVSRSGGPRVTTIERTTKQDHAEREE